jgi:acyl-CoA synthetase (AMP-forming)/AMP-acid ligase II
MAYNIADLFEYSVDAVPERVGFIVDDEQMTYAELEAAANRTAHHLLEQGVEPGDHVGIYGSNSRQWVAAMLAAFKVRAVPVNVNYRYVEDELLYLLDNADLVTLVFDRALAPRVAPVRDRAPKLRHLLHVAEPPGTAAATASEADADAVDEALAKLDSRDFDEATAGASAERDFGERSPDDLYVLYTGGTTGMPKGVVWRHEDVFMALGGGIDAYTNEPVTHDHQLADKGKATATPLISLCLPPLMHGAAQWSLMRFLFEGCTSVLVRKFDPYETWRMIARYKVNNMMMTGDAMARPLIEALEEMDAAGEQVDLSSLFVAASSAAIWSPAVKDRFYVRLPDIMIVDAIGSTETGSNGMMRVEKGATGMQGGPTVTPSRDAVVLDDELVELEPGSEKLGRLARRGNTPIGYYKDEEKTRATFVTGANGQRYVLAGDMARVEADGAITLLGRGSGCINTGGEKVFPEEVESALKAHPVVFDAIVVGVPDERWGQKVAAVVQLRPDADLTLEQLDAHCRSRLAGYKIPRQLTLVEGVERSPSGKPDYPWAQRVAVGAASEPTTTTFG